LKVLGADAQEKRDKSYIKIHKSWGARHHSEVGGIKTKRFMTASY